MSLQSVANFNATTIAVAAPTASFFPTESDWKMMLQIGKNAYTSGLLPSGIKSPEAAAIIALKARELDISIMVGFSHIHIINGKPTMSAELMQSLARKNLPGLSIKILESTAEVASIEFTRPERDSKPYTMTFTLEDAKKAGLTGNVWKSYPSAMLFSRCVSAGLRKVCPDALMGVSYTPEELGAEVDKEGNVIETTSREVKPQQQLDAQPKEPKKVIPLPGAFKPYEGELPDYRMQFGRFKGQQFKDVEPNDLAAYFLEVEAKTKDKENVPVTIEFLDLGRQFLYPVEAKVEAMSEAFEAALNEIPSDPRDGIK